MLGCLIGAAGGPLQAAARTLLIRLAPKDRIAQYFGLFALTGKVTSFIGPLLIGAVTAATASQKVGMSVLVIFFVAGMAHGYAGSAFSTRTTILDMATVHHTDAVREYAYDKDPLLGSGTEQILAAAAGGAWTVVDIAADWSTVYSTV